MKPALLLIPLLAAFARAAEPQAPTLIPPPGWHDVKSEGKVRNAVIALKGPETSSFIVKHAPDAPMDNPAGVRGYLNELLAGIRDASKLDYRTEGRVEMRVFRNGLTAQLLRASLGGEERLVLAMFAAATGPHVAVLLSRAPEAMLPSLLGSLELGRIEGAIQADGIATSLDGQLSIALGGGLRARVPLDAERAKGFVLVIQGSGSEILFQKLAEADATKPGEQAAIVREMAAASAGVTADKASPVASAATAAGPVGVYSWAPSFDGEKMSVGYLPWGYWGYQLFGRGPVADELLYGTLLALKAGPTAVPGLLASTPKIPIERELSQRRVLQAAATGAVLLVILLVWSLGRKKR